MKNAWDQHAGDWDSNDHVRLYAQKAFDTLVEIINPEGLNILDFGCETGLLTEKLTPVARRILALDSSMKMIAVLNEKKLSHVDTLAVDLSQEVITANDLLQQKFDLIVASSVCAFLPDFQNTLKLLKGLLMPSGIFVQWDWLSTGEDADFGFTTEMIASAYKKCGLRIISISEAFSISGDDGPMTVLMGAARNA